MADSAFTNDTVETATDLGTLAFSGSGFDGIPTTRIFDFDSVGQPETEFDVVFPDLVDFFTFDSFDLATVRVNFNADTVGDFWNYMIFAPVSGVSAVTGGIIGSWSGNDVDNPFAMFDGTPLANTATAGSAFADVAAGFATATWDVDDFAGANAVWTLTGAPVVFQVFGLHIGNFGTADDDDNIDEALEEVDYRFTIEPATGVTPTPPPVMPPVTPPAPPPPAPPPATPTPTPTPVAPPVPLSVENDFDEAQTVTGGDAIDTFQAFGDRDDFGFEFLTDGRIIVTDSLFPNAPDTLIGVERIEFLDGFIAFDSEGNAGQAYRLYQAAFDRVPDAEGLGFWIDNYDAGNIDLVSMAQFFMQSEEFAQRYGDPNTLDDFAFLTLLYNNVLDRTPDGPGFDFWSDQQAAGLSRAEMLQYFSESVENNANVADAIAGGIFYL